MNRGQKVVRYTSVTSLESAAMTRIAANLWELQCSEETIDFNHTDSSYVLSVIRSKVLDRLLALPLPKQMKQEITHYLTPIGEHLLDWLDPENFSLGLHTLGHICWTNDGTVDIRETVKSIFDEHKEDQSMFIEISKACAEELVVEAFSKMPEYIKDVNSNHNYMLCRNLNYEYHLVMYWICFCKGELPRLIGIIRKTDDSRIYDMSHSLNKNMFDLSVWTANELAEKYFWQKLTEQEKNTHTNVWIDHLIKNLESWDHTYNRKLCEFSDILFHLLGQMNDCEQRQVFEKYGEEILELLLFSQRWQKYLLETIEAMFPYIDKNVYVEFMIDVVLNVKGGSVISRLFKEMWCASPSGLKTHFADYVVCDLGIGHIVFHRLLDVDDLETLKLIMNHASGKDRKKLILYSIRLTIFIKYAVNNLDTIDTFLREMLTSEKDISQCKKEIMNFIGNTRGQMFRSMDKKTVEDFLRWCSESKTNIA